MDETAQPPGGGHQEPSSERPARVVAGLLAAIWAMKLGMHMKLRALLGVVVAAAALNGGALAEVKASAPDGISPANASTASASSTARSRSISRIISLCIRINSTAVSICRCSVCLLTEMTG